MIKSIVFDMGNVLAKHDAVASAAKRVPDANDATLLYREVFCSIEWMRLDRGTITIEEAAASICQRVPARLHEKVSELIVCWYDDFEVYAEAEPLIRRMKENGYGIYLLSNAGFNVYEFFKRLPVLQWFDGKIISAELHLLKPDHRIYDALLERYSLVNNECFFVDDMHNNVEAALALGFDGMVFRGDFQELEKALVAAGVRV